MWRQRLQRFTVRSIVQNSDLARRRFWVAMMYAGLAGWTVPALVLGLPSLERAVSHWTFPAAFASFAALGAFGFYVIVYTIVYTSTHVVHGLKVDRGSPGREIDERQRAVWELLVRLDRA